jgi:hypothetical protein
VACGVEIEALRCAREREEKRECEQVTAWHNAS